MTDWQDIDTNETGWASTTNTVVFITYDNESYTYDMNFISYDGEYLGDKIVWSQPSSNQTSWKERQ